MTPSRVITDDVIDAMLRHEPVDPAFAPLAAFVRHVPTVGDGPVPRPSDELVAMFEGRIRPVPDTAEAPRAMAAAPSPAVPGARAVPGGQRLASLASKVAGLGLVAKIGLGSSLAAASVAGGGAAGVLPPAANDTVRHAIEVVSPVEFTDPGDGPGRSGDPAPPGPSAGRGEGGDGPASGGDVPAAGHGPGPAVDGEAPAQPGGTVTTSTSGAPPLPGVADATPAATAPSTTPPAPPDPSGQGMPPQPVPGTVPPHEAGPAVTSTTQGAQSRPGA